ncbi:hypothetical protein GCM10028813_02310 [Ramlibacter alkalitolerans]
MTDQQLAERLLQMGRIELTQLENAKRIQQHLSDCGQAGARLSDILMARRYVTDADIVAASQNDTAASGVALSVDIPAHLCHRLKLKVIGVVGKELHVAPLRRLTERELAELKDAAFRSGMAVDKVVQVPGDQGEILQALKSRTVDSHSLAREIAALNRNPDNGNAGDILVAIIQDAIQSRSSDIHIDKDSSPETCSISYRIDGQLRLRFLLTPASASVLVSVLKGRSGMDFSDTRHPQDGRVDVEFQGRRVDVRVASLPLSGESETVTLRILDPNNFKSLEILLQDHPQLLEELVTATRLPVGKMPGLLLITGPTGTGKSTTLYGVINSMDKDRLNIMTSEDPIEQNVPGIRQTLANEATGLTYASILRAQMRQDPDVLVVGECRDCETSEALLRGGESGHLMMSTVHASSSLEALTRVLNLLSPAYRPVGIATLASLLKGVTNQRLARRLCSCCERVPASSVLAPQELAEYGLAPGFLVGRKVGCEKCGRTGYFGRVLVPEAVFVDNRPSTREAIREILADNKGVEPILSVDGVTYFSRKDSAGRLLKAGLIDIDTVRAVTGDRG